jgi:leucyl-tRNA synthetase
LWALLQRDPANLPATAVNEAADKEIATLSHATTKRVVENLDQFKFNTGVSALMEYSNDLAKLWDGGGVSRASWEDATDRMLRLIAPMAPHFADEMWERTGRTASVHERSLPEWDEALTVAETVTIIVQINGKLRARLELPPDSDETSVAAAAMAEQNVQAFVEGKQIRKQIYVPGRLLNLVVG